MKNKNLLGSLVLIVLLLTLTACSKTIEKTVTTTTDGQTNTADIKIDANEQETKVEYTENGNKTSYSVSTEGNVTIPDDYPAGILPVYPNGTVTLAGKQNETHTITITTDDNITDVFNYYEKNTKLDSTELKQVSNGLAMLSGAAGELSVSVMVSDNVNGGNGKTMITLVIGEY